MLENTMLKRISSLKFIFSLRYPEHNVQTIAAINAPIPNDIPAI
ncbi:hypothetical protein LSO10F_130015 [Candidatus Liberibacter solanacearum]